MCAPFSPTVTLTLVVTGGEATVLHPPAHLWLFSTVPRAGGRRKEVLSEEVELNSTGIAQDIYRHFIA